MFDPRGLGPRRLAALAADKRKGKRLADAPRGQAATAEEAIQHIASYALTRPVLVDLTADDTAPVLEQALTHGMDLVLANKRPLAGRRAVSEALWQTARARGRRVQHEATVGAGLPIIDTFHKLTESGDRVERIEGLLSGTLGYVLTEVSAGVPFSRAVRAAMSRAYTEPDPREDLSGMDVGRKALILARLLGYPGELSRTAVESLVPKWARAIPLPRFLDRLDELDAAWRGRVAAAAADGKVLRYVATVTRSKIAVGLRPVSTTSPLAAIQGSDNQLVFTTARYKANPLVITGPGAGAEVTAAGVLNDILPAGRTHECRRSGHRLRAGRRGERGSRARHPGPRGGRRRRRGARRVDPRSRHPGAGPRPPESAARPGAAHRGPRRARGARSAPASGSPGVAASRSR